MVLSPLFVLALSSQIILWVSREKELRLIVGSLLATIFWIIPLEASQRSSPCVKSFRLIMALPSAFWS